MSTNEVVGKVDLQKLGFSANAKPHHIAVEPDGSFWYLSMIGENKVLKFNTKNELVGSAEFEVPGMLAVNPANEELFVARSMSAVNPPKRIGIIDRSSMDIDEVDVFFPRPHALAVESNGKYAFTGSLAENSMMTVDASTLETKMTKLPGDTQTFVQFAISPDNKTMVTGGQVSGKVLIFDISDADNPKVIKTLDVNSQPWHPVFTPDGRFVYLGNKKANTITVVDVPNQRIAAVIEDSRIAQPHGSAVSADGKRVYISNQHADMSSMSGGAMHHDMNGTVLVIDTATNKVIKEIEVGAMPSGIGTRTHK
ncbi:MAG: YncE family protein [Bacteroidetes bacterium]|nr:YncE family protein [Bacteroidota bacterium]